MSDLREGREPLRDAIRFEPGAAPLDPGVEWAPADALVLWEDERADRHRRLLAAVAGGRLLLVRTCVGYETELRVVARCDLGAGADDTRFAFLRREAMLLRAEPAHGRSGLARTLLVRAGERLVLLRITGSEIDPGVEILGQTPIA